jgi:predicted nucleic acid-binding protein
MIVVSDSSPLNYLILIDPVPILPELFVQVIIPSAVNLELQNPGTPSKVAVWMRQRPAWLRIMNSATILEGEGLERLGAGEREAIALSVQHGSGSLLLIDEGKGDARPLVAKSASWAFSVSSIWPLVAA